MKQIPFEKINQSTNDYRAFDNDICYNEGSVYMFLQTFHNMNNVIVFSTEYTKPRDLIKTVLRFIKTLYVKHGIDYISVYNEHRNGWSILKHFKAFQDKDPNQYYCKISENMEKLNEILER